MNDHVFTGLDGQNPLAFFAALGLLRVLDETRDAAEARPRLRFADSGTPTAHLTTPLSLDQLYQRVLTDARSKAGALALALAYDANGARIDPDAAGAIADLKPPPALAAEVLAELGGAKVDRRSADLGAAFFSELAQDNNGNTKPTALHFTAGQQRFLKMVRELREGLTREHLVEALLGPWRSADELPSLTWDSTMARVYALRATDPSKEKRGSVAGANWLGVVGLSFFPVSARHGKPVTTGVKGGWKDSALTWPLWSVPCTRPEVAALVRGEVALLKAAERAALGISQVLRSAITRADQGGNGAFSPAEVVPPSATRRR